MKTLYLLRHAKAEPGSKVVGDADRTLSARGREACAVMGAYLKAKGYLPAFVLSSPSERTHETLELVSRAAGIEPPKRFEDTLYLATAEEILRAVHTAEDNVASAMIVGHNPGMHHLALLLSAPTRSTLRTTLELKYPTCSLTVLTFNCKHWQEVGPSMGTLKDFMTPGDL